MQIPTLTSTLGLSIRTDSLTRVNEALSQTGSVEEGSDKCFVQQMLPAIVTSVAPAVGEVMKSFLKRMPKPADIVNVERSAVVQNLQRNVLLMRYENDRPEQYSRRETIKFVREKEEEGEDLEKKVLDIFKAAGAEITPLIFQLYIERETVFLLPCFACV